MPFAAGVDGAGMKPRCDDVREHEHQSPGRRNDAPPGAFTDRMPATLTTVPDRASF